MSLEVGIDLIVNVRVPHYTHCFGGRFSNESVEDTPSFLDRCYRTDPWLRRFLEGADSTKVLGTVIQHAPDGWSKYPVRDHQEYVVDTVLEEGDEIAYNWELHQQYQNSLWAVVVWVDGMPILPFRPEKQREVVGNIGLRGYRFNSGRLNPGIVFKYLGGDIFPPEYHGHLEFYKTRGIIAASVYLVGQNIPQEVWQKVNLENLTPFKSVVTEYRSPSLG